MKPIIKIKFLYTFFILFCLADLLFVYQGNTRFRFFTKNLLMPLLLLIYFLEANNLHLKIDRLFILGLFFSFLGDFFLLHKSGFLFGLSSFLIAHIFYIFSFKKRSVRKVSGTIVLVILMYLISFLYVLFPYLGDFKIPVIIYGITISTMAYFSFKTNKKLLILGAFIFVVSDSALSVNLFINHSQFLDLLVMITYIFAQFFLVKGILQTSEPYS